MIKRPQESRRGILPRCVCHVRPLNKCNGAGYLVYIATTFLILGCGKPATQPKPTAIPERIISLAPNITETIFALGLGDRLVGATSQCTYPEKARSVPRVGDYGQFSYEAIVSLNPDLVILHHEYDAEQKRLESLGIPYLETGSYYIADILETIHSIGTACGAKLEAEKLSYEINVQIEKHKTSNEFSPRVLMVFGSGETESIHAFGTQCLHNELLKIAGGQNVIEGKLPFSTLSHEAVIRFNPDIIIELAPGTDSSEHSLKHWTSLRSVNAVRNNRIHKLTGDYTCIPGPRFIQTLQDFSKIIHQNDPFMKESTSTRN